MSHMIPSEIPESAPNAEKMIFEIIRCNTYASIHRWIVFHSGKVENPLNPSPQYKRDIDFIIIIPEYFSIICLEVKDRRFDIEDGQWYYYPKAKDRAKSLKTSPPDQALTAMHAFRKEFSRYFIDSLISIGHGVAFTVQPAPIKPLRYPGLMLYQKDIPHLVANLKDYAANHLSRTKDGKFDNEESQLKAQKYINDLQGELMNDMTPHGPKEIVRKDLESFRSELLRLTSEQFTCLERINNNDHIGWVVDGAAGTGKTVLAMELAKRRCKMGETVALLCSNPILSHRFDIWASTLPRTENGEVVAGTPASLTSWIFRSDNTLFQKYQHKLESSPTLEESLKRGYLSREWIPFIYDAIEDLGQRGVFDYLIVDETQNMCDKVFLDLMNVLLKGGLSDGRWAMFGDFTNQDIASFGFIEGKEALKDFGLVWVNDELTTNCRNTHQIAEAIAKLTKIDSRPNLRGTWPGHSVRILHNGERFERVAGQPDRRSKA